MKPAAVTTFDRVARCIERERMNTVVAQVKPETRFHHDLGLSDLDILTLMMAVEKEFDVEFSDDEMTGSASVGELAELVDLKCAVPAGA